MLKSIIKNFSDVGIDVDNEVATRCMFCNIVYLYYINIIPLF